MRDSPPTSTVPSPAEPAPAEFDLLCEECAYSLVGLIHTNQCPECGCYFDPHQLPLARVPWLFRRKIGVLSAYFSTLKLVLTTPSSFGKELCRPVRISPQDASRFRGATGWFAALGVEVPMLLVTALMFTRSAMDGATSLSIAIAAFWATKTFAHIGSDMPTFIWKGPNPDDPHQLSPMQFYSTAPMVLIGVPLALAIMGAFLQRQFRGLPFWYYMTFYIGAALCTIGLFGWLWTTAALFMWAAMGKSWPRAIGLFIVLPIFQISAAFFSFFVGVIVNLVALSILRMIF